MPEKTTRLNISKPLGNEYFNRTEFNKILDEVDLNAAKASDLTSHLADDTAHGFKAWVKSFGLGDRAKVLTAGSSNLNNLDETGFYVGYQITNAPVYANGYFFIHMKLDTNNKTQFAIRYNVTATEVFQRACNNGTWSVWTQLETTAGSQAKATAVQDWAKSLGYAEGSKGTISNFELNTATTSGNYYVTSGVNTPQNVSNYGHLTVVRHPSSTDFVTQTYKPFDSNLIFTRSKINSTTWTAWSQLETTAGSQAKVDAITTTKINVITDNSKVNTSALTDFPDGITEMFATASGSGFPSQYGTLVTNRRGTYGFQTFANASSNIAYTRNWNAISSAWGSWQELLTASTGVKSTTVRNIHTSTADPLSTDGVNGDLWIKYKV